jgi:alpha-D-ribose 1-methylphosphonate 5-triphosphate synthase subunit PhnG
VSRLAWIDIRLLFTICSANQQPVAALFGPSSTVNYLGTVTVTKSSVGGQHFEHVVGYVLVVCTDCRHDVLLSHIKSHVQRAYPAKRKQAKAIAEEAGHWAGSVQHAGELEVPSQIIEPIHQLPVCEDTLMR